jgi:predicted  nucleic acid-binding Zn-ribbon protein
MAVSSAAIYFCTKCNGSHPCQKKGLVNGKQKLLCKNCGKTFFLEDSAVSTATNTVTETKVAVKPKAEPKPKAERKPKPEPETPKVAEIKETKIKINSNIIKTVKGDMTSNAAFDIAVSNFKELKDNNPMVTIDGDSKTIAFKITTTRKG